MPCVNYRCWGRIASRKHRAERTSVHSLCLSLFHLQSSYGELAQMVERSLSMREVRGSMPRFSMFSTNMTKWGFPFPQQVVSKESVDEAVGPVRKALLTVRSQGLVRCCGVHLTSSYLFLAAIAQLGERQTEDLKVPGSIPGRGTFSNAKIEATSCYEAISYTI